MRIAILLSLSSPGCFVILAGTLFSGLRRTGSELPAVSSLVYLHGRLQFFIADKDIEGTVPVRGEVSDSKIKRSVGEFSISNDESSVMWAAHYRRVSP